MKALRRVHRGQPGGLTDASIPEPGPGQVVIRIAAAGACHSTLHLMESPAVCPRLRRGEVHGRAVVVP